MTSISKLEIYNPVTNRWVKMSKAEERRERLQQYILLCIQDSQLTWKDLTSAKFFDKLLRVLSKDVKIVLEDLGRQSGARLLSMGMSMLAGFAADAARKR